MTKAVVNRLNYAFEHSPSYSYSPTYLLRELRSQPRRHYYSSHFLANSPLIDRGYQLYLPGQALPSLLYRKKKIFSYFRKVYNIISIIESDNSL